MSSVGLSRQMRSVLETPDALQLTELLILTDNWVLDCSASAEPDVLLFQIEEELQSIHHDVVDHSSFHQTEVFLAVLYHLSPVLPSISVISSWFDLVLRPALREPKLPTVAVNHAKELIISALQKTDENYPEKVGEFRRRLLDLYLLDAFNAGSGNDVLEWAGLDEEQREKRTRWKSNLEDILLRFGTERPQDLMTEIYTNFATPSSRLQLLMLLDLYISASSFQSSARVLATHPLLVSLLSSLLLDNSSTVCTMGLTLLVKLLPIFAVYACEDLKRMLPELLAILARIMCWKERPPSSAHDSPDGVPHAEIEQELEIETNRVLYVRSDLDWQQLELTFNATASVAPSPRQYFTTMYYLFPCNVLRFLRGPVTHLTENKLNSPYTVNWEDALDEDEIRSKSESLLRGHICHPLIIWRDAAAELSQPDFWAQYDVSRITSEAAMLSVRNSALGTRERQGGAEIQPDYFSYGTPSVSDGGGKTPAPTIHPIDLASGRAHISLQDMITTSVALKSNINVEILNSSSQWPAALFPTSNASPQKGDISLPGDSLLLPDDDEIPSHVAQAISGLQREVILLRNELNFELWLSRENAKHVGRLYQDRILSKTAEAERQGLYNKLRKYRTQVIGLERELREHKEQASSAKNKYADWNTELQKKLREFREEKKSWISEAAMLRAAEKEARALFAAQGTLLADATKEVFELQTQKKENQPKIDRLKDYERQIDQNIKMQRLWDGDFRKFNDRADQIQVMKSQHKQMEMHLESYEKSQAQLEENARVYRRQIQALEARISQATRKNDTSRQHPAAEIAAFVAEKSALTQANNKLREENADLRDEAEEMRAMVEVLKAQISGRRGLVSEPRASPLLYG